MISPVQHRRKAPYRYGAEHPVPPLRPITQRDIDALVANSARIVRQQHAACERMRAGREQIAPRPRPPEPADIPPEPSLRELAAAVRRHPGQRSEDYARQTFPGFRASSFTAAVRLGLIDWTVDDFGDFRYWPARAEEMAA